MKLNWKFWHYNKSYPSRMFYVSDLPILCTLRHLSCKDNFQKQIISKFPKFEWNESSKPHWTKTGTCNRFAVKKLHVQEICLKLFLIDIQFECNPVHDIKHNPNINLVLLYLNSNQKAKQGIWWQVDTRSEIWFGAP